MCRGGLKWAENEIMSTMHVFTVHYSSHSQSPPPLLCFSSHMLLNDGIPFSTYCPIIFKTLFGVRWAFGGRFVISLNPKCGTLLARSSCAMLRIGVNCFHSGCRET